MEKHELNIDKKNLLTYYFIEISLPLCKCLPLKEYNKIRNKFIANESGNDNVVSQKTFDTNKRIIKEALYFLQNEYLYNPYLTTRENFPEIKNLIHNDLSWKNLHTRLFFSRLLFFLPNVYKPKTGSPKIGIDLKKYEISPQYYPLYYVIIACIGKEKQGWINFKGSALRKLDTFFSNYPDYETLLYPYSMKCMETIYKFWLDSIFPDELYILSNKIQEACYNTKTFFTPDRVELLTAADELTKICFLTPYISNLFFQSFSENLDEAIGQGGLITPFEFIKAKSSELAKYEEKQINDLENKYKDFSTEALLNELESLL